MGGRNKGRGKDERREGGNVGGTKEGGGDSRNEEKEGTKKGGKDERRKEKLRKG